MNEREMRACAYVTKRLDEAADEVYQEMYGEWKDEYFYYLGIQAPDYLVFMYQVQTLLPKAYMNGEPDAKPNLLFKALKNDNLEKTKNIIRRAQFMTVTEFAKKNNIYYELARKEIRSIWTVMTGNAKCEPIPVFLEDKFVKWMNSEIPDSSTAASYTNLYNMKNSSFYTCIFEMRDLAIATILISSKSESDFHENLNKLNVCEEWFHKLESMWNNWLPFWYKFKYNKSEFVE